jgi:glycine C-acetyltransferase
MVDEAHSFGALGETGRGVDEYFGLNRDDIDIKMGSLSKSIPSCGGFIAGSHDLCFALRKGASSWWFTAASSPADTAAALAALKIMEREPERVKRLHENTARYKKEVKALGFDTMGSPTPIVPLVFKAPGDTNWKDTMALAGVIADLGRMVKDCIDNNLWVLPVFYPAVPRKTPRLRTTVTAGHTDDDISFVLDVLEKVGKKHGQI